MGWLGVAIFVAFSLGLSLFFQFDPKRLKGRPEIADLDRWLRVSSVTGTVVLEERKFIEPGRWLQRSRLVQQQRHRDIISGEVTWVGPERVVERWFEL